MTAREEADEEIAIHRSGVRIVEIFKVLERLKRGGTSILVIEQNARPVFEIAHGVSVLERGRVVMAGSPTQLVDDPRVIEAYLGVAETKPGVH